MIFGPTPPLRTIKSIAIVAGIIAGPTRLVADEIHDLAWAGDFARVKALIDADPKLITAEDDLRQIPLHLAARGGHPEMVQFLLDLGSPVNRTAYNNFTPLHLTSNGEVARILIRAGADLNSSAVGMTVLQYAANTRKMQIVNVLQEAGVAVDLRVAVELGLQTTVKEILAHQPAPTNEALNNALLLAAGKGHRELVELLLASGANINHDMDLSNMSEPWTPLSAAAISRHWDIGKLLLERGANPNVSGGKGSTSLLDFAASGAPTWFFRLLLEKGANPNAESSWGDRKLLHEIVQTGNLDSVAVLLEFGAEVNGGDGPVTPLLLAAAHGKTDVAGVLLANGASIDIFTAAALGLSDKVVEMLQADPSLLEARDGYASRTPLGWAAAFGHANLAKTLVERGAQVGTRSSSAWPSDADHGSLQAEEPSADLGLTPLHFATQHGDIELVRVFLEHGADPNAQTRTFDNAPGTTPLHVAARQGSVEIAALLIEHGANVNISTSHEGTPLHQATKYPAMIKLLVDHGADVDATNTSGETALDSIWEPNADSVAILMARQATMSIFTAIRLKQSAVAKSMVKQTPELANAIDSSYQKSSVLQAAAAAGMVDVVQVLIEHGASLDYADGMHRTALWEAAEAGNAQLARLLLSKGAALTQHHYFGSPLYAAAKSGSVEIGRLLLEKGVDVHQRTLGWGTVLHVSAANNRVDYIKLLLQAGLDVNIDGRGDGGSRPLHSAATAGALDAARVLLDSGADIHAQNYRGETALDCARRENLWWSSGVDVAEQTARRRAVAALLEERLRQQQ